MDDAIAHFGALGPLEGELQSLVFGERFGGDDLAADVLQHRRRMAACLGRLADPARRLLEGGDADARGVHHCADLHARQVALFLGAAVLDDAHVAALARGGAVAAHDRAQAPRHALAGADPALRLDGARARLERLQHAALAPGEQQRQIGRALGKRHRHAAGKVVERRIRAHQQAAVVEEDHAHRAQVEPVIELAHGAVGALARGMLGGRVLQHVEVERSAVVVGEHTARDAVPALEAARVDDPHFAQLRLVTLPTRRHPLCAALPARRAIVGHLKLDRIAADKRRTPEAAERDEGVVDVDDEEVGVLQHRRKGRLPEDLQGLLDRRRQSGRLHSSAAAPIRARNWARLISATLISRFSAASRYS